MEVTNLIFSGDTPRCSVYRQLTTVIPHIACVPRGGRIKSQSSTIYTIAILAVLPYIYACQVKGIKMRYL